MTRFNHLNVPDYWQQYWTKYPEGYTILESLLNWVAQVDSMVDNVNNWNTYLDNFIATFELDLQVEVIKTLNAWKLDGTLDTIIMEAIDLSKKHTDGWVNAKEYTDFLDVFKNATGKKHIIPAGDYFIGGDLNVTLEDCQIEGMGLVNVFLTDQSQTVTFNFKHASMENIYFIGLGKDKNQKIIMNDYRLMLTNVRFKAIQYIESASVYNWLNKVHFLDNGVAFKPTNLSAESGTYSTMFDFDQCVFMGNDTGLKLGDGVNFSPIHLSLTNCGFENNGIGIDQYDMCRLANMRGCWFEGNTTAHTRLYNYGWVFENNRINDAPEKFEMRPFETSTLTDGQGGYSEITQHDMQTSHLTLQNILGSRSVITGRSKIGVNSVSSVNGTRLQIPSLQFDYQAEDDSMSYLGSLLYTNGQEYNARATICINSDGTIAKNSFHLPITVVKVATGQYKITWDSTKYLLNPHIFVSSYTRSVYPTTFKTEFAVTFTPLHSDWSDYGKMNEITVFTKDSAGTALDNKFTVDMSYTIETL
jgi:hypothetical protein